MPLSAYARNAAMEYLFTASYASLHTADPGLNGANELHGGEYARIKAAFSPVKDGTIKNAGALLFDGLPGASITHVGFWDTPSGGNFIWGAKSGENKTIGPGDSVQIDPNEITLVIS